MILVDSNVIVDVLFQNRSWCVRSGTALVDAARHDEIAINPIINAEIAPGFGTIADPDSQPGEFRRLAPPRSKRRLGHPSGKYRRVVFPYAKAFVIGFTSAADMRSHGAACHQ